MSRKLTIEQVREEFSKADLELLSNDYVSVDQLLPFRCKNGHNHKICLTALRKNVGCSYCKGNKIRTLDYIKGEFYKVGYTLLESDYKNNKQLLSFICDKGHKHSISYSKLRAGRRCAICSTEKINKHSNNNLEQAQKEFLSIGYTPLFSDFKGTHVPLRFKCDNGHEHQLRLKDLRSGIRCSFCKGGVRYNFDDAKNEFLKAGLELLETSYKNYRTPMCYKCSNGHIHKMSLSNVKKGNKCPTCSFDSSSERSRLPIEDVYKKFTDLNYTPLFTEYVGAHTKVPFLCDKGHYHEIMPYTLDNGVRCRLCSLSGVSRAEKEISTHFKELGFSICENYRKLISPYEVDVYFPDYNLAIEYCGLYWHSEINGEKLPNYHYKKMMACRSKKVRLITIFEDEYLNRPNIVLSRIESSLGFYRSKIHGRNCTVTVIDKSLCDSFLDKNHLQGSSAMKIAFGLYYKEDLVGVMTGGNLSRNHKAKSTILEMKRLCFLPGYKIMGGASKLFKQLLVYAKASNFSTVRSYQDMRYGDSFNPVYEKLGFLLSGESKYTPHYVMREKRFRNHALRKSPQERLSGKTEWELRKEQGYDRIWDCGHRVYDYSLI